jgi:hypothetical protein
MKILITEQQLSNILNESSLNSPKVLGLKEDMSADEMIDQMKKRAANKISVAFTSLGRLRTLESEDMKRKIKRLLDSCEKFEYKGSIFYVFQQIPSLRPENVIFKDNRREIALYIKPNVNNPYEKNIIYYNKLVFNRLASKYKGENAEYVTKYNIINVLIDEDIITKESFTDNIRTYYVSHKNNRQSEDPLFEWFDKFIHGKVTSEILQKTGLRNLKDLDLHSMKPDSFSDEGLSGFSKLKRNINRRLTGLDEKESYYVSKLANIFDLAFRDEENSSVFNISDEDGNDYKIFDSYPACSVFLKNAPITYDDSLVSYFENIGYKFTDLVKKAADKSSNTDLKNLIRNCNPGYAISLK